jgi:hypothetical protein
MSTDVLDYYVTSSSPAALGITVPGGITTPAPVWEHHTHITQGEQFLDDNAEAAEKANGIKLPARLLQYRDRNSGTTSSSTPSSISSLGSMASIDLKRKRPSNGSDTSRKYSDGHVGNQTLLMHSGVIGFILLIGFVYAWKKGAMEWE